MLKVPRFSVDIDLNYIGAADRETMLSELPKVEQAVQTVCGRLGMRITRMPSEHAGGKWRLTYTTAWGRPGTLELEVNFLLRTPLWAPVIMDSHPIGSLRAKRIPVLGVHELAAGKLAALFDRTAPRDLFDAWCLLRETELDQERLRLALIIYGGTSRRDWRNVSIDNIHVVGRDVAQQLLPMLQSSQVPRRADIRQWTEKPVNECRSLLSVFLPMTDSEMQFLTTLNDKGEIVPELITQDTALQSTLRAHPGLLWKAQNVREYLKRGGVP